jgi:Fungal fucose-specific lectin
VLSHYLSYLTSGTIQIRVYYVNSSSVMSELYWDPAKSGKPHPSGKPGSGSGWFDGSLNNANFQVAPYSNLSAFMVNDSTNQLQVNLYAQMANNTIQEYQLNGKSQEMCLAVSKLTSIS